MLLSKWNWPEIEVIPVPPENQQIIKDAKAKEFQLFIFENGAKTEELPALRFTHSFSTFFGDTVSGVDS